MLKKVKGHATQEHVTLGVINEYDRTGNCKADELATYAQQTCEHMVGQLSTYFAERHHAYIQFICSVHSFLLHMFRAVDKARAKHDSMHQGEAGKLKKLAIEPSLPYPYSDESVDLDIHNLDPETFQSLDKGSKRIFATFCGRTWALAPQDTQGASWLEMCILFFLHGGRHEDLHVQGNSCAQPSTSLRNVLQAFKNKAKFVLEMCLVPSSLVFFKPSTCPHNRGRILGYTNHTPCIGGVPVVTHQEGEYIAQCLVELRHVWTNNSRKLLKQGLLELPARKYSLRGIVPESWKSYRGGSTPSHACPEAGVGVSSNMAKQGHIPEGIVFEKVLDEHVEQWLVQVATPNATPDTISASTLSLKCPVCMYPRECINTKLLKGSCWQPVACKQPQCKATRASSKWNCMCNVPWYTCPAHAPIGHRAGRKVVLQKSTVNQNLPKPSPACPEAGVGVLCRRAKRKQDQTNGGDVQRPKKRSRKHINEEAILAIQRLREARQQSRDPGDRAI